MRALYLSLTVLFLSLGAFALEESITLRFVLKDSASHFEKKSKETKRKLRGIGEIAKLGGHSKTQSGIIANRTTQLQCEADAYAMLLKISKKFIAEDALSSSFVLRSDLKLKGDDLKSLFDFFITPYLEYLNYKTEFLTAAISERQFDENDAMPFFVSELNIDEFCKRRADLRHYGEDGKNEELELTLPDSIKINTIARGQAKVIDREIERAQEAIQNSVQSK